MKFELGRVRAAMLLALLGIAGQEPWQRWGSPPTDVVCPHPVGVTKGQARTQAFRCAAAPGAGPAIRGPARLLFGLTLDLNRADPLALEVLPGIGPARAAAIVAERERRPFARVSDITRVRGIGPVTLARLKDWVSVEPLHQSR
jgi:hypothetical protein